MAGSKEDVAAGGGAGSAIGSLLGWWASQGDRDRSMDAIRNLDPTITGMAQEDPELRKRQLAALQRMWETSKANGLDPQSRAQLAQAQAQTAAAERGSREAIVQGAKARGVGGSGVEFAAALSNQQGAATRGAMAGTQAAGDASQRALQALQGTFAGSGAVRGQDLSAEEARKRIEMFNAEARRRKAEAMAGLYGSRADDTQGVFAGIGKGAGGTIGYLTGGG